MPEEALKVRTHTHSLCLNTHCQGTIFTRTHSCIILLTSPTYIYFLYPLKHEKFTSSLQLSKKPPSVETTSTTTTSKSPIKTPTKTPKSPSSTSTPKPAERSGVTSSKEPAAKPVDSHKAEERLAGERQLGEEVETV